MPLQAAPIRQPRGPSANPSADSFQPPAPISPPSADQDSHLRRNNTIGSTRHQPSASISASAAASGAFHGGKYRPNRDRESRFRSGSLSNGSEAPPLVRRQSGRENVQREEIVHEDHEVELEESGSWASGLSRQSSLPSRRGNNGNMGPPPRPPRRVNVDHSASHSLSSLAMVNPVTPSQPTSVSRTQSLRSQARNGGDQALGRSSSLRQAGEHYRSLSAIASPPTPPPASSTAALPPFQLDTRLGQGADIKRHQSLGQYRHRPTLLPLDARKFDGSKEEEPPTSPIGRSVWAHNHPTVGDDGWSRSIQGVQEAFTAMNFRENTPFSNNQTHNQDEPSWVANLVGGRDNSPAPPLRAPSAPIMPWQNQNQNQGRQQWPDQGFNPYLQQQQQQQMMYQYKSGYNYFPPSPVPLPVPAQDQEVIDLARKKGLNPATFDCRPHNARFFVIKSYTEDDVQKSLKHEIWSSTVLGNKRLDTAFKENSVRGPVYLFFSVNSSRHFCGVAQMLTAVDETQSSTVWAQDKWKGIFKVKWIFVRDVPSAALRHIRLINTTEQKPITNSRDTQEVHYDGGCEVLSIFLDHQNKSKTSLLQDFTYYETMSHIRPQQPPQHQQPGLMLPPPVPMQYMQAGVPPVPPIPSRYR